MYLKLVFVIKLTAASSVSISDECITAVNALRSSRGAKRIKYIVFKISDDQKHVVVQDMSSEQSYEVFRENLCSAIDAKGNSSPRYAVYDVEYDLGNEGKRSV
jgi:cofilin